jgi:hypothetical protein
MIADFHLTEVYGPAGPTFLELTHEKTQTPLGAVRVFRGDQLGKVVYIHIDDHKAKLKAYMLVGFTGSDSVVPHFFLDLVQRNESFFWHLDLMPKRDLSQSASYLKNVYQPLTEYSALAKDSGFTDTGMLSLLQKAFLSPWLINKQVVPEAYPVLLKMSNGYYRQWRRLVNDSSGISGGPMLREKRLSRRDFNMRRLFFSDKIAPVWEYLDRLIGREDGELIRQQLWSND